MHATHILVQVETSVDTDAAKSKDHCSNSMRTSDLYWEQRERSRDDLCDQSNCSGHDDVDKNESRPLLADVQWEDERGCRPCSGQTGVCVVQIAGLLLVLALQLVVLATPCWFRHGSSHIGIFQNCTNATNCLPLEVEGPSLSLWRITGGLMLCGVGSGLATMAVVCSPRLQGRVCLLYALPALTLVMLMGTIMTSWHAAPTLDGVRWQQWWCWYLTIGLVALHIVVFSLIRMLSP